MHISPYDMMRVVTEHWFADVPDACAPWIRESEVRVRPDDGAVVDVRARCCLRMRGRVLVRADGRVVVSCGGLVASVPCGPEVVGSEDVVVEFQAAEASPGLTGTGHVKGTIREPLSAPSTHTTCNKHSEF
jgi:hypothetical protein